MRIPQRASPDRPHSLCCAGEVDGVPVQNVSNYFPWERSPGIDEVFRSFGWEPTEEVLFAQDLPNSGVAISGAMQRAFARANLVPR